VIVRDRYPSLGPGRDYCDRGAILAGGRLELFDDVASAFERYRRMLAEAAA
jgi:hypothetical protein